MELEVAKTEIIGVKDFTITELIKLCVDKYKASAKTIVRWYDHADRDNATLFFNDEHGFCTDQLTLNRRFFKNIIRPAIVQSVIPQIKED